MITVILNMMTNKKRTIIIPRIKCWNIERYMIPSRPSRSLYYYMKYYTYTKLTYKCFLPCAKVSMPSFNKLYAILYCRFKCVIKGYAMSFNYTN